MADQPARLEAATVKAEVGSGILYQFSNDPSTADDIPTLSGNIPNLKKLILVIQQTGADKISFATKIYATTAAGIAATVDQEIFLVQSSSASEIYAVWQNVSGAAVDTGKRSISASAVVAAVASAQAAADAASDAAASATTKVAPFHSPSSSDPTTRDDGSALQIGDTYFNTTLNTTKTYSSVGWVASAVTLADLNKKADINSPTLTGTPLATTATLADSSKQIATTEFVQLAVAAGPPSLDGGAF